MSMAFKGNLRKKAMMVLLAFSMVPLLVLFTVTYAMIDKVLREKVDAVAEQSVGSLAQILSNHFQTMLDMTLFSARSKDLAGVLLHVPTDKDSLQKNFFDMKRLMNEREILARFPSPYQYIAFSTRNGIAYGSLRTFEYTGIWPFPDIRFLDEPLRRLSDSYSQEILLVKGRNLSLDVGPDQIYSAANVITNDGNLGVLLMGIDISFFSRLLDHARMNDDTNLYVFDANGDILVQGARNRLDAAALPAGIRTASGFARKNGDPIALTDENRGYKLIRVPILLKGFRKNLQLVMAVPLDSLYAEKRQFVFITLLLASTSLAGIALMALVMQRTLIRPILSLHRMVESVRAGDLDAKPGSLPQNELGQLGYGLTTMTGDLRRYIGEIRSRESERREMEIGLLQSQIKPHFVRNTLNTIRWMAEMKGAEGVGRAILSLSLLMEYNFREAGLFVRVRDELEYTREYVYLQRIRYQNKFEFHEDIPPELQDCMILRLSFQPLVENAIHHGLALKKERGCLNLSGKRTAAGIEFLICDDGLGMSPDILMEAMQEQPPKPGEERWERIAIGNIRQRLAMQYGDRAGMEIESREGAGTTVRLFFPYDPHKEGAAT